MTTDDLYKKLYETLSAIGLQAHRKYHGNPQGVYPVNIFAEASDWEYSFRGVTRWTEPTFTAVSKITGEKYTIIYWNDDCHLRKGSPSGPIPITPHDIAIFTSAIIQNWDEIVNADWHVWQAM